MVSTMVACARRARTPSAGTSPQPNNQLRQDRGDAARGGDHYRRRFSLLFSAAGHVSYVFTCASPPQPDCWRPTVHVDHYSTNVQNHGERKAYVRLHAPSITSAACRCNIYNHGQSVKSTFTHPVYAQHPDENRSTNCDSLSSLHALVHNVFSCNWINFKKPTYPTAPILYTASNSSIFSSSYISYWTRR